MGKIKTLSNPIVKDGVQGIILIKDDPNFFCQKYLLIQDHDDRGRSDGVKRIGLPGGAIEKNESSTEAFIREIEEETGLDLRKFLLEEFGCYQKLRPNGFINDNYLFIVKLNHIPVFGTNDPNEVSKVLILSLREIIGLFIRKKIHEGSMRLIVHFLNGQKAGLLNNPAIFNDIQF